MRHNSSPFKWRHFEPSLILLCVRWYEITGAALRPADYISLLVERLRAWHSPAAEDAGSNPAEAAS
jgi:hypothetical protein